MARQAEISTCTCDLRVENPEVDGETIRFNLRIVWCPLHEAAGELRDVLQTMVRQNQQRHAVGHDAFVKARAVLNRIAKAEGQS